MKILLISPDFSPEQTMARSTLLANVASLPFFKTRAYMPPLGLATLAALTPEDIHVDIWDEAVRGQIRDDSDLGVAYDLAGITGYSTQYHRVKDLGRVLRRRGMPVAVGGPGVSGEPELYRGSFDVLFLGEAESTWQEFVSDRRRGSARAEYRQVTRVDMADSPRPRWTGLEADMPYYLAAGVQTTRGCPFDCEFCDVVSLFGREARHKSVEQVLEEVRALERLGVEQIFFCDDNFIGDTRFAKDLLRELGTMNRSFRRPIGFLTQLTLNVAKDDELLELLADANFNGLVIGLETPNRDSLIETDKPQNYRTDMVADVKKIQSYGLPINPGMVVGFDHDDVMIFDRLFEFLQGCGLGTPVLNTLKAPAGTRLWRRLNQEGRLVDVGRLVDKTDPADYALTNIVPKGMTRLELLTGYRRLVQQVRDWNNFEARVKEMISQQRRAPRIQSDEKLELARLFALFGLLASMDEEARGCSLRMLDFTREKAPHMINRVIRQIVQQYLAAASVPALLRSVEDQIELELKGSSVVLDPAPLVPESFRRAYARCFPDLYEDVRRALHDEKQAPAVLLDAVSEFFRSHGQWPESLNAEDVEELRRACGKAAAAENNRSRGGSAGETEATMRRASGQTGRSRRAPLQGMAAAVLESVERDVRCMRPESAGGPRPGRSKE